MKIKKNKSIKKFFIYNLQISSSIRCIHYLNNILRNSKIIFNFSEILKFYGIV